MVSQDATVRDTVLVRSLGLKERHFLCRRLCFVDADGKAPCGCLAFDSRLGELSGHEGRVRLITACSAAVAGLVIADRGDVWTAVRPLQTGAWDVVQKPY